MKKNDMSNQTIRCGICIDDIKVDRSLDDNINEALIRCIESSGMSMAQFCKITGIAQTSIVRYRQKAAVPTLETIVTACIALRTNVFQALYLISIAGYNLFYSKEKKVYLLLIMLSWYIGISIETANEILIDLDMPPLNKKNNTQEI